MAGACVVAAVCALGWSWWASLAGMPAASDERPAIDPRAMARSVDALAQRLRSPTQAGPAATASDWELLARSSAALRRFREADQAYAKALEADPRNARLMADRADVVLAADDPQAADRAAALVQQALALEPLQPKALALALRPGVTARQQR